MKKLLLLLLFPILASAQDGDLWRLEFDSPGGKLPVHILVNKEDGVLTTYVANGEEKMEFDRAYESDGGIHMFMDLYDLEFVLYPNENKGFINKRGTDMLYRQMPFTASKGDKTRFKGKKANAKLSSKYEVVFRSVDSEKDRPAIGVFQADDGNTVTGTFVTRSGDNSYLQGNIIGDSLYLSFISTTPGMYKAKIQGDSLIGGEQFSVFSKGADFYGVANENFALDDAAKRTYLNDGYDKFDFTFKDEFGENISLSGAQFSGKVTVVQILGTWCPNCLEETKFLMDYRSSHPELEVIGLAFERSDDPDYAYPKIFKFKERFGVDYPVLLAGSTQNAAEKLPQLNHIMAFPTSIIVDKNGEVRKIHTGFSGPGTGSYYDEYVEEFNSFVGELLNE